MIANKHVEDLFFRRRRLQKAIAESDVDGILLTTDVNVYYMTGIVFNGYYYLPAEGEPVLFVKRPDGLSGDRLFSIRKIEQIPELLLSTGQPLPEKILLETDVISYNECMRLREAFGFKVIENASTLMRRIRMVKSPWEISRLRISAEKHAETYSSIRSCYRPEMTDLMFQAEIERLMRLNGSIGLFRVFGSNMSIFMGSILTGDNAQMPSPYDFALGGAGQTDICPIGANGTTIRDGMAVMVDMVGNYTEYMTDMTRVFSLGKIPELALRAHRVSIEINEVVEMTAQPGVRCDDLYNLAFSMAKKAGLTEYFMGTRRQARFVGHGIGLEINEPPVLTPRSTEILEPGIAFALEPKFVIPHVGAVGIENSFLVTENAVEKLTRFPEEIIPLD
ncbi:MAG: Xaa-Pro peptidase family protein [Tannerella sp.]|jgi:Xaa-Pro aminopeptidase|nr:Xaa-Pro peptidase family protein [Tannerella sp.]